MRPGDGRPYLRRGWRTGSTRQDPKATPALDRVQRNFTATAPKRLLALPGTVLNEYLSWRRRELASKVTAAESAACSPLAPRSRTDAYAIHDGRHGLHDLTCDNYGRPN